MKTTIKKEIVKCDICEDVLTKRSCVLNDRSYQEDYLTCGDIDLCFKCAGKIVQFSPVFSYDKWKDNIESFKNTFPSSFPNSKCFMSDLNMLLKKH